MPKYFSSMRTEKKAEKLKKKQAYCQIFTTVIVCQLVRICNPICRDDGQGHA
jgi:hypothetical protein